MYPFYPAPQYAYPYMFGPRLNTLTGIPVLKTTGVSASTTEVRYDVKPCEYRMLPNEGLFFLDVRQSVPVGSEALPVALESDEVVPDGTSMLLNAQADDVLAQDLVVTVKYLIYYNKCTKSYQLVNAYTAPATVAANAVAKSTK